MVSWIGFRFVRLGRSSQILSRVASALAGGCSWSGYNRDHSTVSLPSAAAIDRARGSLVWTLLSLPRMRTSEIERVDRIFRQNFFHRISFAASVLFECLAIARAVGVLHESRFSDGNVR